MFTETTKKPRANEVIEKTEKSDDAINKHVVEKKQIEKTTDGNKSIFFTETINKPKENEVIEKAEKSDEVIKTHVTEKKQIEETTESNRNLFCINTINNSNENKIIEKSNKPDESIENYIIKEKQMEKSNDSHKNIEAFNKPKENQVVENSNITEKIDESSEGISEFKKKQKLRNLRNFQNPTAWPSPNLQNTTIKSDDFKIIEKKNPKEEKNIINSDKKYENDDLDKNYVTPKTSVQFYLTWKNLKSSDERYRYLKKIDPQELPKIFQSSLDSGIFSNIIEVLVKHFIDNKTPVSRILYYLTQVKRFSAITMFMTDDDKSRKYLIFYLLKFSLCLLFWATSIFRAILKKYLCRLHYSIK